jgi:hypothetical protein
MSTKDTPDLLAQFRTIDTAELTVEHPRGGELTYNGEPVVITLYGPGTDKYIRAKHKLDNDAQARSVALLRGQAGKRQAEENLKSRAEFLAACTAKINNFPISDALTVYSDPGLGYIADQVDRFLASTENFMPI